MNKSASTHYDSIIGLEVHAQLLTDSKMFCACATSFGNEPNTNICPVCTGQPGTLPALNKLAVEFAIRAGLAMNCNIENVSVFARKNYFYPDLPKGYQISQYDRPLCRNGSVDVEISDNVHKKIGITRIHLEEDAGKLLHDLGGEDVSHVDYNRSGVPLIEIVSGPDMRSPAEGVCYLKVLRNILVYLNICDGNMQEGSFRCDANISLRPKGSEKFGTRTEIKNLNSFKAIERALAYEIYRQEKILNGGGAVEQDTLLWNDAAGRTEPMRSKEEAHDYRYFPEPDLPPLVVDDKWIAKVRTNLPELANSKAKRLVDSYDIPEYDAGVLTQDKALADYFEACVKHFNSPKKIANWIITELLRELKNEDITVLDCKIGPNNMARLVAMVETDSISGKIGKTVFEEMYKSGGSPEEIVKEKGLIHVTDADVIEKVVDEVLKSNAESIAKYKSGKTGVFGHFVGEVMKLTKGKANPKIVNELLKKKLG